MQADLLRLVLLARNGNEPPARHSAGSLVPSCIQTEIASSQAAQAQPKPSPLNLPSPHQSLVLLLAWQTIKGKMLMHSNRVLRGAPCHEILAPAVPCTRRAVFGRSLEAPINSHLASQPVRAERCEGTTQQRSRRMPSVSVQATNGNGASHSDGKSCPPPFSPPTTNICAQYGCWSFRRYRSNINSVFL